jgi:hypothetical protein
VSPEDELSSEDDWSLDELLLSAAQDDVSLEGK